MSATLVLALGTVIAVGGSIVVFVRDLAHDERSRSRVIVEAALPVLGLLVLVWWSWAAL